MAAHNGGLGQMEVELVHALLDRMRLAGIETLDIDFNAVNNKGYPIAYTRPGCLKYNIPNTKYRPGNWKIWWDGTLDWTVSNATVVSIAANYKIIKPSATADNVGISLKSLSVAPTYIHCTHVDDEAAFLGGEYLTQAFIDQLNYLKPGKMRFMNEAGGSHTTAIRSSHLMTEDYLCWGGQVSLAGLATNKIASAATKDANTAIDEYDVTVPGWVGDDHDTFWMQINSSLKSTTIGSSTYHAMKIGVNGGARKKVRIWSQYSEYIFDTQKLKGNSAGLYGYARFRYNATLDCFVLHGGNGGGTGSEVPFGTGGDVNHVPFSLMAKIATRFGCHLQFSVPCQASDLGGSAVTAACAEVQANLGPGLIAFAEIGNENWNTNKGFWDTQYTLVMHNFRYNKNYTVPDQGYGAILAVAAPVIHAAFGGDKTRYQLACGLKTAAQANISATTGTPRISAGDAVTLGGKTSPRPYIDEINIVTYYNSDTKPQTASPTGKPTDIRWINWLYWARKYRDAVASGDTVTQLKALRYASDGCLRTQINSNGNSQPNQFADIVSNQTKIQSAYPGMKVAFYEGGYSAEVLTGEPTVNVTGVDPEGVTVTYSGVQPVGTKDMCNTLSYNCQWADPKMKWIAFQYYRRASELPLARFPSMYGFGPYGGTFGNWGRLNNTDGVTLDMDAHGFSAFSNDDSIMLASCA